MTYVERIAPLAWRNGLFVCFSGLFVLPVSLGKYSYKRTYEGIDHKGKITNILGSRKDIKEKIHQLTNISSSTFHKKSVSIKRNMTEWFTKYATPLTPRVPELVI